MQNYKINKKTGNVANGTVCTETVLKYYSEMLKDLMDKRDKTSIIKLFDQFNKEEIKREVYENINYLFHEEYKELSRTMRGCVSSFTEGNYQSEVIKIAVKDLNNYVEYKYYEKTMTKGNKFPLKKV